MKAIASVCHSIQWKLAALLALTLAMGTFASAQGHHGHKPASLKLTQPTRVGGAMLEPGEYKVRTANSADDAEVEFVRQTFDPTVGDSGLSPYGEEVVARVKSSEQALCAPSRHTQLEIAPEAATAIALEIRSDAVEYLFGPPQMEPAAIAACAGGAR